MSRFILPNIPEPDQVCGQWPVTVYCSTPRTAFSLSIDAPNPVDALAEAKARVAHRWPGMTVETAEVNGHPYAPGLGFGA